MFPLSPFIPIPAIIEPESDRNYVSLHVPIQLLILILREDQFIHQRDALDGDHQPHYPDTVPATYAVPTPGNNSQVPKTHTRIIRQQTCRLLKIQERVNHHPQNRVGLRQTLPRSVIPSCGVTAVQYALVMAGVFFVSIYSFSINIHALKKSDPPVPHLAMFFVKFSYEEFTGATSLQSSGSTLAAHQ